MHTGERERDRSSKDVGARPVKSSMLRELSDVFALDACEREESGFYAEADRLWAIADELAEKYKQERKKEKARR